MPTQLRIASGTLTEYNVPCKLDEILHFKSNSSPERVYLPPEGSIIYPYPELP